MPRPIKETKILKVEVNTSSSRIVGHAHLLKDFYRGRLTDFLNLKDVQFIPITEAEIYRRDTGGLVAEVKCIVLNKDFVESILPLSEE
ncbi:MAG: hypothetical protein QMD08_03000 [Actinomycetota bacterium]|nr:hypothetical protein [Actinomycetota bacterium]